jgi:tetratricopeptide (TPR) repeat protein
MKHWFNAIKLVLLLGLGIPRVALAEDSAADYVRSGLAKQERDDPNGAVADYDRAIQLDPTNARVYEYRGRSKLDKGDSNGALADYDHAIQLDPKRAQAYVGRGGAKLTENDQRGAIADYSRGAELDPTNAQAFFMCAHLKAEVGDNEEAIVDYSRAIQLHPNNEQQLYEERGGLKLELGDATGAINDYNSAIRIFPEYGLTYYDRGLAKELLRDWRGARADYERCIKLMSRGEVMEGEDQYYPHLSLWLIRARLGETKAATRQLSDYVAKGNDPPHSVWVSEVAGFFLGTVTEAKLLDASKSSPSLGIAPGMPGEGWYFVGMKKLFDGRKKAATECFRKCIATKVRGITLLLARSELQALGE